MSGILSVEFFAWSGDLVDVEYVAYFWIVVNTLLES